MFLCLSKLNLYQSNLYSSVTNWFFFQYGFLLTFQNLKSSEYFYFINSFSNYLLLNNNIIFNNNKFFNICTNSLNNFIFYLSFLYSLNYNRFNFLAIKINNNFINKNFFFNYIYFYIYLVKNHSFYFYFIKLLFFNFKKIILMLNNSIKLFIYLLKHDLSTINS